MVHTHVSFYVLAKNDPCAYVDDPYFSETRFNWLHFCRPCMPTSIQLGAVSCNSRQQSLKLRKRYRKLVIEFVTNRKDDFLLVVNSHVGRKPISHSRIQEWNGGGGLSLPSSFPLPSIFPLPPLRSRRLKSS